MKVWVQLHNGEERTYENVIRIDEGQYGYKLYSKNTIVADINKGDVKNLLTD